MSEVDPPVKSQLTLLREQSDVLEQSRKAWLDDSFIGYPLWKLNYAVSDIGYLLATLDDPEAIKQGKRWMKLQQKLSDGIVWLRTVDLLRDCHQSPWPNVTNSCRSPSGFASDAGGSVILSHYRRVIRRKSSPSL